MPNCQKFSTVTALVHISCGISNVLIPASFLTIHPRADRSGEVFFFCTCNVNPTFLGLVAQRIPALVDGRLVTGRRGFVA